MSTGAVVLGAIGWVISLCMAFGAGATTSTEAFWAYMTERRRLMHAAESKRLEIELARAKHGDA